MYDLAVCACVCGCVCARVCTLVCVCVQAASLHAGSAKVAGHSQATSTKSNLATAMGSDLKQLANLGPAKNTKKESKPAFHISRPVSLESANNSESQGRTSCSKDQLQALQKRCASSDDHYLYRVMDDEDMQLESCYRALQDANAFAHDIICECPYSDFAMEKFLDGKSTKYILTTRSPAYAIYDALALVEHDRVRCPLLVQIDIQKLPNETKIADFSLGLKAGLSEIKFERKWGKYQFVVVKDCIPARAVVGCFQIKSKEKDAMSQVLQQGVNGKSSHFNYGSNRLDSMEISSTMTSKRSGSWSLARPLGQFCSGRVWARQKSAHSRSFLPNSLRKWQWAGSISWITGS
jgi:hypothetical protein